MKFAVLLFIVVLTEVQGFSSKGWNAIGHKNEYLCSLGWSGYLNRFFMVTFLLSGLILYYVPESRSYFRRGCHGVVDFVADGLKYTLNLIDSDERATDYCSSSATSSEQEAEFLSRRRKTLSPIFLKIRDDQKHFRDISDRARRFENSSTHENLSLLPYERPGLDANKNRKFGEYARRDEQNCLIARNADNEEFVIVAEDSEPTNYPEDESNYDCTQSELESDENYVYAARGGFRLAKKSKYLQRRLCEFDEKLKDLRSLFVKKFTRNDGSNEEYAARLIEAIFRSLKENFDERREKCLNHRRDSRAIAVTRQHRERHLDREDKGQPLITEDSGIDESRVRTVYRSGTTRKKSRSGRSDFRSRKYTKRISTPSTEKNSTITSGCTEKVVPMIERAVRWFRGSCSEMEPKYPFADTSELRKGGRGFKIVDSWLL